MHRQPGRAPILRADAAGDGPGWAAEHREALRDVVAEHGSILVRGLGLRDAAEVGDVFRRLSTALMTEREAFAARHGIERVHDSYRAVIDDPDVDVLYIATPHPMHHAVALAAIDAGKALLVEKAFTATVAGAVEVVDRARAAGVFVMEAMWTRFQPAVVALRELIADGAIGAVRSVQADLGA